jgi:hypothetical protein
MTDNKDDDTCDGEDYVVAGPVSEDGKSMACIRHYSDHSMKVGIMRPMEDGKPIPENAEILERIGSGPYYKPLQRSGGPTKVSTKKYKDGWERIFSGDSKSKLN